MQQLASARSHYLWSAALAVRAVRQARKARKATGGRSVAAVVALHQATAATQASPATAAMLSEQGIDAATQGLVVASAFVTPPEVIDDLLEQIENDWQFNRLVASIVAEAGREAASVSIAATVKNVGYVRYLSPPSCSRCAVLAGRWYRWSAGFDRHPGCDCTHVPTTETASPELVSDPTDLLERGQITGLAKADVAALQEGASWSQIINAKSGMRQVELYGRRTQITTSGTTRRGTFGRSEFANRGATRRARLTPRAIYKAAGNDRAEAVRLLRLYGYLA